MNGIALLAIGDAAYGKFAYNIAISIKHHSPNINIQLIYEDKAISHLNEMELGFFDIKTLIDKADCYDGDKLFPAKAKLSVYKYFAFEETIYLDVDGVLLKPIEPLFEECKGGDYFVQIHSVATKDNDNWEEMLWAWTKDIWQHFKLKDTAKMPATNSSFQFVRKGKNSKKIFEQALKNLKNPLPIKNLRMRWGTSQPDELYLNVALAQLELMPILAKPTPILFTNKIMSNYSDIEKNYYLLGIYGGRGYTHGTMLQLYDRLIHSYSMVFGQQGKYKISSLLPNKLIHQKNSV